MQWTHDQAVRQISRYNTIAANKVIILNPLAGSMKTSGAVDYLVKVHGYTQA